MSLRKEFTEAIEKTMPKTLGEGNKAVLPLRQLHQIIVGPSRSGKTTLAKDYIQELAEEGLIADKPYERLGYLDDLTQNQIDSAFDAARNGVVIIDDIERDRDGERKLKYLRDKTMMAVDSGDCVVILIGTPEHMDLFMSRELDARMPSPRIRTDRVYTPEEMEQYDREAPLRMQRRLQEREEKKRLQSEQLMKELADVSLRRDIQAMKPLRFAPKERT